MNKKLVWLLLLLLPILLIAQEEKPLRIELEGERETYEYTKQLMGREGVALIYPTTEVFPDSSSWVVVNYDTNLIQTTVKQFNMPASVELKHTYYDNGKLHLLFYAKKLKKEKKGWQLISIETSTQTKTTQFVEFPFHVVRKMEIYGDFAVFETLVDTKHELYIYDLKKGIIKFRLSENVEIPYFDIEFFSADATKENLFVGLDFSVNQGGKRRNVLNLLQINFETGAHKYTAIKHDDNITLVSARFVHVSSSNYMILGCYNDKEVQHMKSNIVGVYSVLFSMEELINENSYKLYWNSIKLHPLSKMDLVINNGFKNIQVTYLNSAAVSLRTGNAFSNRGIVNLILEMGSASLGVAAKRQVLALTFDEVGDYNSLDLFKVDVLLQGKVSPFTSVYTNAQREQTYYCVSYHSITTKKAQKGEETTSEEIEDVPLQYDEDKLLNLIQMSFPLSTLEEWYDGNLLFSGYQWIENESFEKKDRERWVFFLSKMKLE